MQNFNEKINSICMTLSSNQHRKDIEGEVKI